MIFKLRQYRFFVLWIISMISLQSCAQDYTSFHDMAMDMASKSHIQTIKASELQSLLKHENSLIILDAREPQEYEVSHIKGAINIGYDHANLELLNKIDRETKVVIYCSVGYRSGQIGEKLKNKGFKHIFNLYGGIFDWINSGYKVVNSDNKQTNKVHPYNNNWGKWLDKKYWSFQ